MYRNVKFQHFHGLQKCTVPTFILQTVSSSMMILWLLASFPPYHSVHGLPTEDLCQRSQALMPTEMAASNLAEPAAFLA